MAENFSNNYSSALDGAIDDNDLSLVVLSESGSPDAPFRIKVENEYMLVTAKGGTGNKTFTVEREIEGSTATSHADGTLVTHVVTAASLELITMGDLIPRSAQNVSALVVDKGALSLLTRPSAVNAEDDHFDTTSIDAKWTVLQGSPNFTDLPGWLHFSGLIQQAVPAGDWSISTEIVMDDYTAAGFTKVGLWLSNSATTTGTQKFFFFGTNNTLTGDWRIGGETYVNNAFSAGITGVTMTATAEPMGGIGHRFVRVTKTGTTYEMWLSDTGKAWYKAHSTSSLGITPTHFGIKSESSGYFNYFLRT